jgi:NAD(P)-dependent dehydrogenase (short-subunit alcohol dehydrogenase family)
MELKGSTAIVTGAAKRVGKAIACALAHRGVNIVVHYHHSEAEAHATVQLLEREGVRVFCIRADLSCVHEIDTFIAEVRTRAGDVDILVNAASQFNETPFGTITEGEWDLHLDVNLKAVFFLSQGIAKSMLQQKKGKIVNIIDAHISHPYLHYVPYLVSKTGLVGLTHCLARELAPHIQVNAIAPGPVLAQPSWSPELIREIIDSVPLRRMGSPEDIAKGVLFCIEGTDFMTGAVIPIDGGQRLQ